MAQSTLSPDDLKLIIGNFQNLVQMNTILLEQQKQLLDFQRQLIGKNESISTKQSTLCNQLEKMSYRTEETMKTITAIQEEIMKKFESVNELLSQNQREQVELHHMAGDKQNTIVKKVEMGWLGMGSILLALIGLFLAVIERNSMIRMIYDQLEKLLSMK